MPSATRWSRKVLLGVPIVLLAACAVTTQPTVRSSASYVQLDGMLVSPAVTVTPAGQVTSQLWSESVSTTAYELTAPVSVQISCNMFSGEFAKTIARYQLRVTADPELKFRKRFLEDIYQYWREKPKSYLDSYKYLPAEKSVLEKSGRYLLYIQPGHERLGATYLFYANQRVFELELKSVEGGGWGPLTALIAEHLAFRVDDETIDQIYFEPKYPPVKLLALYESGAL